MNTTDKIMAIVGEAFREGFYSVRTYNDTVLNNADEEFQSAATSLAKKVIAEIEALVRDAEELAFLKNDLISWVDHAVEKGNANSDIQEAAERYDQWMKTRRAAMQEKQS